MSESKTLKGEELIEILDVTFLIYKTREYLFIDSNYLGIREVR